MKKLFYLFFSLLAIACNTNAQSISEKNVPANVSKAWSERYPKTEQIEWFKWRDTTYGVRFVSNGKHIEATYDKNAVLVTQTAETDAASLPLGVSQMVISQYPDYKFEGATSFYMKTPVNYYKALPFLDTVSQYYLAIVHKGDNYCKLYFSNKGQLIGKDEWKTINKPNP